MLRLYESPVNALRDSSFVRITVCVLTLNKRPATSVAGLLNFREVLGVGREQKEALGINRGFLARARDRRSFKSAFSPERSYL